MQIFWRYTTLAVVVIMYSCSVEYNDIDTRYFRSEGEWIVDVMRSDYLFANEIPNNIDYSLSSSDLFYSLLSEKEMYNSGLYFSYIQTTEPSTPQVYVSKSETVDESPIQKWGIINTSTAKVAYLLYNTFAPGMDMDNPADDRRYDDELSAISRSLKSSGVSEMVLDLRYNGGGNILSMLLLGTILAPEMALERRFCTLQFNDGSQETYNLSSDYIRNGDNLNLKRLYVLTSRNTASASELLIHSLREYMEVVIIGDRTLGKNMGSRRYTHEDFNHTLRPIVCYVFNSAGSGDYSDGLAPDYMYKFSSLEPFIDALGTPEEPLLKIALSLIDGNKVTRYNENNIIDNINLTPQEGRSVCHGLDVTM